MPTACWLIGLALLGQADGWVRYPAKKGGFVVTLPGRPQERDEKVGLGNLEQKFHALTWTDGRSIFAVYYHDNPHLPQARREPYLDDMKDGKIQSVRGKLWKERRIELDKHPGREFSYEVFPDRQPVQFQKMRIYLVGDRLYQLTAVVPRDRRDEPEVDRFLDSFTLTEKALDQEQDREDVRNPWQPFKAPDGKFAVSLPAEPTEHDQEAATPAGPIKTRNFAAQGGPIGYNVAFTDYDRNAVRDPKRLLDVNRKAVAAAVAGRVVKETKIGLGRHPGREFHAEYAIEDDPKGGLLRSRLYLVGRRLYSLTAAGPKAEMDSNEKDVAGFFDSFRPEQP